MNTEELIERLERAGIDPAFNDEVIEALREQQAEIERFRKLYADEGRKAMALLEENSRLKAEIERLCEVLDETK